MRRKVGRGVGREIWKGGSSAEKGSRTDEGEQDGSFERGRSFGGMRGIWGGTELGLM